ARPGGRGGRLAGLLPRGAEGAGGAGPGDRGDALVRRGEAAITGPRPGAGPSAGVADVVDRRPEHLADRLEADAPDRRELVGRERRSPGPAAPDLGDPRLGGRPQLATGLILPHLASSLLR